MKSSSRSFFRRDRFWAASVSCALTALSQRHSTILAHGKLFSANFSGWPEPRTHDIRHGHCHSGVSCEVTDNLRRAHWETGLNIPFNGLGVASAAATMRLRPELISLQKSCDHPLPFPIDGRSEIAVEWQPVRTDRAMIRQRLQFPGRNRIVARRAATPRPLKECPDQLLPMSAAEISVTSHDTPEWRMAVAMSCVRGSGQPENSPRTFCRARDVDERLAQGG